MVEERNWILNHKFMRVLKEEDSSVPSAIVNSLAYVTIEH